MLNLFLMDLYDIFFLIRVIEFSYFDIEADLNRVAQLHQS